MNAFRTIRTYTQAENDPKQIKRVIEELNALLQEAEEKLIELKPTNTSINACVHQEAEDWD